MRVVAQHIPATTEQEYDRALLAGQAYLQSVGVVGWQDAIIGDYAGTGDPGPVYLRAARRGSLTAHVVGALWWDRDLGLEQIAGLVQRRAELSHGRFQASSVKIMQDGVAENGTAALGAPYLDDHGQPTANPGTPFSSRSGSSAAIAALAAEGFPVHVHAIGDRAVQEALDAFAHAAGADGGSPASDCPSAGHRSDRSAALRRAGGGGRSAGLLGLPGRADDRTDAAVPRCRIGPVGSTRSGICTGPEPGW